MDRLGKLGSNLWLQVLQRRNLSFEVLRCDRMGVVATDRPAAREHLEEHDAEGENVGARVDLVSTERLLGRHVLGRTHHHAGAGESTVRFTARFQFGDAEVEDLHQGVALGVDREHHVVRFEIAVNDGCSVSCTHPIEHLQHEGERVAVAQAVARFVVGLVQRLQRLAVDEFHHHVGEAIGGAIDVGYAHDVRALDTRGHLRFLQEALDQALTPSEGRVEELERDRGAKQLVASLVDAPHPTIADQSNKPILVVDELADLGFHQFLTRRTSNLQRNHHSRLDAPQPNLCSSLLWQARIFAPQTRFSTLLVWFLRGR